MLNWRETNQTHKGGTEKTRLSHQLYIKEADYTSKEADNCRLHTLHRVEMQNTQKIEFVIKWRFWVTAKIEGQQ